MWNMRIRPILRAGDKYPSARIASVGGPAVHTVVIRLQTASRSPSASAGMQSSLATVLWPKLPQPPKPPSRPSNSTPLGNYICVVISATANNGKMPSTVAVSTTASAVFGVFRPSTVAVSATACSCFSYREKSGGGHFFILLPAHETLRRQRPRRFARRLILQSIARRVRIFAAESARLVHSYPASLA